MPDYDNTNRGVLFPNDKEGNEKRPDFTGEVNIDGRDLRLAAWKAESKGGMKYLQLKVSEKEAKPAPTSDSGSDNFDW